MGQHRSKEEIQRARNAKKASVLEAFASEPKIVEEIKGRCDDCEFKYNCEYQCYEKNRK